MKIKNSIFLALIAMISFTTEPVLAQSRSKKGKTIHHGKRKCRQGTGNENAADNPFVQRKSTLPGCYGCAGSSPLSSFPGTHSYKYYRSNERMGCIFEKEPGASPQMITGTSGSSPVLSSGFRPLLLVLTGKNSGR